MGLHHLFLYSGGSQVQAGSGKPGPERYMLTWSKWGDQSITISEDGASQEMPPLVPLDKYKFKILLDFEQAGSNAFKAAFQISTSKVATSTLDRLSCGTLKENRMTCGLGSKGTNPMSGVSMSKDCCPRLHQS